MRKTAHKSNKDPVKQLESILATTLTVLFLSLAGVLYAYSYIVFQTPIKNVDIKEPEQGLIVVHVESEVPVKTHVEYGTSDLYVNKTKSSDDYENTQAHIVWGLIPDRDHYFRVVAWDSSGRQYKTPFYKY